MRTVKDLLEKRGPKEAYPANLGQVKVTGTIYNERATSPKSYDFGNRRRYKGVFTETTTAVPYKAMAYRVVEDRNGRAIGVEVDYKDARGTMVDHFSRLPDRCHWPCNWSPSKSYSRMNGGSRHSRSPGERCRAGKILMEGLYISGSATQFRAADLPAELQKIIQILGISENTVSLWVHGALAERNALSFVATHQATNGRWRETVCRKERAL